MINQPPSKFSQLVLIFDFFHSGHITSFFSFDRNHFPKTQRHVRVFPWLMSWTNNISSCLCHNSYFSFPKPFLDFLQSLFHEIFSRIFITFRQYFIHYFLKIFSSFIIPFIHNCPLNFASLSSTFYTLFLSFSPLPINISPHFPKFISL